MITFPYQFMLACFASNFGLGRLGWNAKNRINIMMVWDAAEFSSVVGKNRSSNRKDGRTD
jgi:hypothetical protein